MTEIFNIVCDGFLVALGVLGIVAIIALIIIFVCALISVVIEEFKKSP